MQGKLDHQTFYKITEGLNFILQAGIIGQALRFQLSVTESANVVNLYSGEIKNLDDYEQLKESCNSFEEVLELVRCPKNVKLNMEDRSVTLMTQFGRKVIEFAKIMLAKCQQENYGCILLEDIIDRCNGKNDLDNDKLKQNFEILAKEIIELKQQQKISQYESLKEEILRKMKEQNEMIKDELEIVEQKHQKKISQLKYKIENINVQNGIQQTDFKHFQKCTQQTHSNIQSSFNLKTDQLNHEIIKLREYLEDKVSVSQAQTMKAKSKDDFELFENKYTLKNDNFQEDINIFQKKINIVDPNQQDWRQILEYTAKYKAKQILTFLSQFKAKRRQFNSMTRFSRMPEYIEMILNEIKKKEQVKEKSEQYVCKQLGFDVEILEDKYYEHDLMEFMERVHKKLYNDLKICFKIENSINLKKEYIQSHGENVVNRIISIINSYPKQKIIYQKDLDLLLQIVIADVTFEGNPENDDAANYLADNYFYYQSHNIHCQQQDEIVQVSELEVMMSALQNKLKQATLNDQNRIERQIEHQIEQQSKAQIKKAKQLIKQVSKPKKEGSKKKDSMGDLDSWLNSK